MKMQFGTVCIIGPGLIGGSIGLGLKQRNLVDSVIGVGYRASSIEKAVKMHAVDIGFLNVEDGVKTADIVILATSVNQIIAMAEKAIPNMKSNAILTDVGSTKNHIVRQITNNLRNDIFFIGAHPIAGSEQSGVEFATPNLFEGSACVITPSNDNYPSHKAADVGKTGSAPTQPFAFSDSQPIDSARALEIISALWRHLGARVIYLTPDQHDEILASVSHLPHLAASCLINAISKDHIGYGASGLRDTSRVASGDPELWLNILDQNREHVVQSIDRFMEELAGFKNDLLNKNNTQLLERLKRAKVSRDSVFHNNSTNQRAGK